MPLFLKDSWESIEIEQEIDSILTLGSSFIQLPQNKIDILIKKLKEFKVHCFMKEDCVYCDDVRNL